MSIIFIFYVILIKFNNFCVYLLFDLIHSYCTIILSNIYKKEKKTMKTLICQRLKGSPMHQSLMVNQ